MKKENKKKASIGAAIVCSIVAVLIISSHLTSIISPIFNDRRSMDIDEDDIVDVGEEPPKNPSGYEIIGNSVVWENNYGRLEVYPHTSTNIVKHTQQAIFTSNITNNIDIAFRFESPLGNKDIWIWKNISHDVSVPDYGPKDFNYILVNILDFEILDNPPEIINLGDDTSNYYATGTASYWDDDIGEWDNGTFYIGFDSWEWLNPEHTECNFIYEQDNAYLGTHIEEQFWFDWHKITHLLSHQEHNNKHYYFYTDWSVVKGKSYLFKWQYNIPVVNGKTSGKWDLLAKLHSDTIQEALDSGRYVMLDPWWDSDWDYYKTCTVANKRDDYQMELIVGNSSSGNVTCEGHANSNFSDLRFVYDNTTELPYWIENYTADTQATVWINNSGNYSSFEMFYGNSGASTTSNGTNTFVRFDDFEDYANNGEPKAERGWSISPGNGNNYFKATTTAPGLKIGTVMHGYSTSADQTAQNLYMINFSSIDSYAFDMDWYMNDSTYLYAHENGIPPGSTTISQMRCTMIGDQSFQYYNGAAYVDYNPDVTATDNTWHKISFRTWDNDHYLEVDGTLADGGTKANPDSGVDTVRLYIYRKRAINLYLDDFRIRYFYNVNAPSWSGFGSEQIPPGPPTISINFAGNLSDSGGPYWNPTNSTGESLQLAGAWSDGYYTNDSRQSEGWIYINCTITDAIGVGNVWLNWLNETTWTNWTYAFTNVGGNYWEINTSNNFSTASGYNYSFNVVANNTASPVNSNTTWWNKTGLGGSATRRWVQLNCTQTDISYSPFYFYNITYTSDDENKEDRLHHDQGADNTIHDTGYLLSTIPNDAAQFVWCTAFLGYWFDESSCISSIVIDNIYYHFWWSSDDGTFEDTGWEKNRTYTSSDLTDSYPTNSSNNRSSIYYNNGQATVSNTYYLDTNLLTITPTSFTDNDIYELCVKSLSAGVHPSTVSNRSFTSFVLLNVPSNATLNATYPDSDSDGRSDWEELYVDYTNPFLADTDDDGVNDLTEYLSGSDPNNYTDTIPYTNYAPNITGVHPANNSVGNSLSFTWNCTIYDDNGNTFDWTIECGGFSNSSNDDTDGNKTLTLTGLGFNTIYVVWVNVTDGLDAVSEWFNFTTINPTLGSAPADAGWELVSIPYNGTVLKWDVNITIEGYTYSWNESASNNNHFGEHIILPFLYGWDFDNGNYITATTFEPYKGYWLYWYHHGELYYNGTAAGNVTYNVTSYAMSSRGYGMGMVLSFSLMFGLLFAPMMAMLLRRKKKNRLI